MKILIVEDEGILSFNIRRYLLRTGHEICGVADNGRDAVDLAGRHRPDLILMDVRLKFGPDGIETARQIRLFLSCPILFTTAYVDADSLDRIGAVEGARHLPKPYDLAGLSAAVEECAGTRPADDGPAEG
jgi:CheY-like chemotaxis protein